MAKKVAKHQEDAEIDMTPMLDIVFIMLIFFIVTASFVKEAGVEVTSPFARTALPRPGANVFVGISQDGEVYIDGNQVELADLKVRMQNIKAESPEGSWVIQADKGSKAGVVMKVLDAAKAANVRDVTVAAERN